MNLPEEYSSLRRILDLDPGPRPNILYDRSHEQGRLTASVHGSHVRITVSLRTWWARLMDLRISDVEIERTCTIAGIWLRVAFLAGVIFLACEIVPAFFPGGPVDRIKAGH